MNFQEFLGTVQKRAKPFPEMAQHEKHAQLGMISEVGELATLMKKAYVKGTPVDKTNLLEEAGDWLWFLVLYCWATRVSMAFLDAAAAKAVELWGLPGSEDEYNDQTVVQLLATAQGLLVCTPDMDVTTAEERVACVEASLLVLLAMLFHHGFTLEQCLIANDAKLEARHGQKFNAGNFESRDTAAERVILENHVTSGPGTAAG